MNDRSQTTAPAIVTIILEARGTVFRVSLREGDWVKMDAFGDIEGRMSSGVEIIEKGDLVSVFGVPVA